MWWNHAQSLALAPNAAIVPCGSDKKIVGLSKIERHGATAAILRCIKRPSPGAPLHGIRLKQLDLLRGQYLADRALDDVRQAGNPAAIACVWAWRASSRVVHSSYG
jgi:hypothetical protein